jgi:2-polyprenyl-3-methyl-5-hydroxy-6-metoxy-1,4-benzoquinol methylase
MTDATTCWACGARAEPANLWNVPELHLMRCPSCGLVFTSERDSAELQRLYDEGYFESYPGGESYEADPAQRLYEANRRIEFVRRYVPRGKLLEIGAAAGHFVEAARDAGYEPVGIEPAADLARRATERVGVPVLAGFLEEVELPDGEFDVACAWHVVEHIIDPHNALVRLRKTMKPGATLLVEVPNIESVQAKRRGARWANLDLRHHVGHYTPAAIRALLTNAGFRDVTTETFPMRGYLRPGRALRPIELAAAVKEVATVRAAPWKAHPTKHELLRAVAVAP